jgi:hypothetical protein
MGIFDRLKNVIKSYLDEEDYRVFGPDSRRGGFRDPDLDAAYDELNDYLGKGRDRGPAGDFSGDGARSGGGGGNRGFRENRDAFGPGKNAGLPPEKLRPDFAELGLPLGASGEECKSAYKKLLKIHHPDRHAGHPGNFQKATAKSARINAAYDRIERWRETGKTD